MKNNVLFRFSLLAFASVLLCSCANEKGSTSSFAPSSSSSIEEIIYSIPETAYDNPKLSSRIMYVNDLGFVTGRNNLAENCRGTDEFNIKGTDLGFTFFDPEINRLFSVFGDTSLYGVSGYVSTAVLYTDEIDDFSKGINWTGALPGSFGLPLSVTPTTQVLGANQGVPPSDYGLTNLRTRSTLPTGACVINGTYYLWYMENDEFGQDAAGNWDIYGTWIVKSEDKGMTWSVVRDCTWVSHNDAYELGNAYNFGQIYPLVDGDYVYIYGIPGGRSGGVKLGRALLEDVEHFDKYHYFKGLDANGEAIWTEQGGNAGLDEIKDLDSSYIVGPQCSELCVYYNPYLHRYVMMYLMNNTYIVMRRSKTPWGEWSSHDIIMGQTDLPQLYGGFTSDALLKDGGKQMFMMISDWVPYNVHLIEVVFN